MVDLLEMYDNARTCKLYIYKICSRVLERHTYSSWPNL